LFIIFGFRVFYRTVAEGTFYCRKCGGDRQYMHRVGRRWFTLFFIPVIPLNRVSETIQCATCKTRYVMDVLNQPTAAQKQAELQSAMPAGMRAAAVAMLRAGDQGNPAARQQAVSAITGAGAGGYSEAALEADLSEPDDSLKAALGQVGTQLKPEAREWYLADVVKIGLADAPLTDSERAAVLTVGSDLGMTQAQVLGVIAMTEQSAGRN
jgi:zinc ribbon protein